jgi:hypothetical protein
MFQTTHRVLRVGHRVERTNVKRELVEDVKVDAILGLHEAAQVLFLRSATFGVRYRS